jgi:ribonuclease D
MGYPTGLARLVAEILGVELGKGLTYTSWDRRPLSKVHQRYAADDVRYLPALKDVIVAKLEALGHADWAAQECAALCDRALYDPNPLAGFHKMRGVTSFSARKRAVLAALLAWRDQAARQQNTPVRTLLADQIVASLARHPVTSIEQLGQISGLPRPVRERHGRHIVELTAAALEDPSNAPPAPPGKTDETATGRVAIDGLWATVCGYCHGRGIDPGLVTSRQEIASWYRDRNNGTLREGWRRAMLGEVLEAFIEGRASVQLNWTDGTLRAERS